MSYVGNRHEDCEQRTRRCDIEKKMNQGKNGDSKGEVGKGFFIFDGGLHRKKIRQGTIDADRSVKRSEKKKYIRAKEKTSGESFGTAVGESLKGRIGPRVWKGGGRPIETRPPLASVQAVDY